MPGFMLPIIQDLIPFKKRQAAELLRHASDLLGVKATQDDEKANVLTQSVKLALKDDESTFNEAFSLLLTLVENDRKSEADKLVKHKSTIANSPVADQQIIQGLMGFNPTQRQMMNPPPPNPSNRSRSPNPRAQNQRISNGRQRNDNPYQRGRGSRRGRGNGRENSDNRNRAPQQNRRRSR